MDNRESTLCLDAPKLLDLISFGYDSDNVANLKSSIDQPIFADKNDKKNRLAYKSPDFLGSKKNKIRQKKKTRSKLYVGEDLSSAEDDLGRASINSFVRGSKNLKAKKDVKGRKQIKNVTCSEKNIGSNEVYLEGLMTVQELSDKLRVANTDIIKWLFMQGISVTINQSLDISISALVAEHYSFTVLKKKPNSDFMPSNVECSQHGKSRAPVITLLGHVDHGKTSLLKAFRQDKILIQEAGNITQSIRSHEIFIESDPLLSKIIILDTPGHEAFAGMRKRGADITDLAILVVSADDGLKPQTIEAINYIQDRSLPFVVAINKIDKVESDINRVKQQLADFNINDLTTSIIAVSALSRDNIDSLLSSIIQLSKKQDLKSDPYAFAEGTILEAHLDRQKGPVAQLLIQNGTLRIGDIVLAGSFYGKVKAITNNLNEKIKSIEAAALADILCFADVPTAGLSFSVINNEKKAKALASSHMAYGNVTALNSRISLDDATSKCVKKIVKQVNLIIKTSTQGAIDAIVFTLTNLPQEKVQINLLLAAPGEVSWKDIELAATSNSVILAFGFNISPSIFNYAQKKAVIVCMFDVIYDLINYVESYMLDFVDLEYEKQLLGCAEVKSLFVVNKAPVAGCSILKGNLKIKSHFRVQRSGQYVYVGLIDSLKRLKESVAEVFEGNECGVMCKDYSLWEIGDLLECYDLKPMEKTLS